ncbi:MAG TPA: cellulose biosynthesis protein BcsS [Hyphomicrobiaceae bacterium]|jgi:hypothetical protein|nr:cellulose biosynthesis protein BcsS [Hyphomicrobiaceae bacterium]
MIRNVRFWTQALVALGFVTLSQAAAAGGSGGGSVKDSQTEPVERGSYYSGYDIVKDSRYWYDGITVALNGDMGRDGFFVRAYGARGDFDRNPGDGRQWQADFGLGYMFTRRQIGYEIYVGADYENVRLSPDDPTAQVRGTEWGFKVGASIETDNDLPYYFSLDGNYSTAFNTYWTRARAGLHRGRFTFGPEFIALGDQDFDAQRVGGFVRFDVKLPSFRPVEVTLSAGHQFVSGSNSNGDDGGGGIGGGEGTYGLVNFSVSF